MVTIEQRLVERKLIEVAYQISAMRCATKMEVCLPV